MEHIREYEYNENGFSLFCDRLRETLHADIDPYNWTGYCPNCVFPYMIYPPTRVSLDVEDGVLVIGGIVMARIDRSERNLQLLRELASQHTDTRSLMLHIDAERSRFAAPFIRLENNNVSEIIPNDGYIAKYENPIKIYHLDGDSPAEYCTAAAKILADLPRAWNTAAREFNSQPNACYIEEIEDYDEEDV